MNNHPKYNGYSIPNPNVYGLTIDYRDRPTIELVGKQFRLDNNQKLDFGIRQEDSNLIKLLKLYAWNND